MPRSPHTRLPLTLSLALLLGGCACLSGTPAPVTAAYACTDGTRFTAEFEPAANRVVITRAGSPPTIMAQTVSGSGIRYSDGTHVFHAKDRTAFWITGGTRLVGCREMTRS